MFKKKEKEFDTPYTLKKALVYSDKYTKLSMFIMGFNHFRHKRFGKGALFLLSELFMIIFMLTSGIQNLVDLIGLGSKAQTQVWNEAKGVYEYTQGDNSLLILLYGIATIFLLIGLFLIWKANVKSSYQIQEYDQLNKRIPTFKQELKELLNKNLHHLLLSGPILGIFMFTILPLVFMISMAFTNYSIVDNHLILFDWVGLKNFVRVFNMNDSIGKQFWGVLAWTLVWAVCATFLNYVLGMLLAIIINRKETKAKGFWRFCFILSIAVPQFVSLLIMRTMLQSEGAVNVLLKNAGLISQSLPFFTDTTWARVSVIIINLWVGIPYTLMQVTGILQNIPGELYESAKIDGASPFVTFFKITLPYMLFVTTPYLITQFTGNVNNFNVIYLLSGGEPTSVGDTAGKTDLLVTWLYKLTIDKQYYNIGAVIGILTFVVLAIVALVTYRHTNSYKDEEGFM